MPHAFSSMRAILHVARMVHCEGSTPLAPEGAGKPDDTGKPEDGERGRGRSIDRMPTLPEQASDRARARVALVFERKAAMRALIEELRDLPKEERRERFKDLMADFRELFKALSDAAAEGAAVGDDADGDDDDGDDDDGNGKNEGDKDKGDDDEDEEDEDEEDEDEDEDEEDEDEEDDDDATATPTVTP